VRRRWPSSSRSARSRWRATLASLEAQGLIERSPDPDDGRRIPLALSAAGRETVASKRTARTAQFTRALSALSAAERAQLQAVSGSM
jgi:DNA-binding MarR family transcriptional regulator